MSEFKYIKDKGEDKKNRRCLDLFKHTETIRVSEEYIAQLEIAYQLKRIADNLSEMLPGEGY